MKVPAINGGNPADWERKHKCEPMLLCTCNYCGLSGCRDCLELTEGDGELEYCEKCLGVDKSSL